MKSKKGIYNVVFGILGQVVILALGIIVPRLILRSYGDEANGLINAIAQIFTYLALIEAGVGQAALQSLYKPVVDEDYGQVNSVLSATQKMFRKLTKIYMVFVVALSFIYPLIVKVNDTGSINFFGSTYWAVFFIVLIQGSSNSVSFYFVSTLRQILLAEGRSYISVNITTFIKVLTSVLRIVLINAGINLVLIQLVYIAVNVLEVLLYYLILKKRYPWLNLKAEPDKTALKQRNSFFVHEVSNVVFSSTDILVLSIICDLNAASIYAVYTLVFSAVSTLISQVHNGCFYILGQTYNQDKEKYVKVHDLYDTLYIMLVFICISITYVLILPFISIYTGGVTDITYVDKWLPLLFCSIQLLSCCRITSSNLIKIAGHAKNTIINAIAEAVINIVVSVALAFFLGIYGVLIGTIVALLYRANDMIIYANKKILNRNPFATYKIIIVNLLGFVACVFLTPYLSYGVTDLLTFALRGLVLAAGFSIFYFFLNIVVGKELRQLVGKVLKRKKDKPQN